MDRVIDTNAGLRFVARLRVLTPADWRKLADGAAPLRGESIGAVWRRAELNALALGPFGANLAAQSVAAAGALIGEFSSRNDDAFYRLLRERALGKTGKYAHLRELLVSMADAHDVVVAACPGDEAVHEAVMAALHAACWARRAGRSPVTSQYRYVEPVIPLAEILAD